MMIYELDGLVRDLADIVRECDTAERHIDNPDDFREAVNEIGGRVDNALATAEDVKDRLGDAEEQISGGLSLIRGRNV